MEINYESFVLMFKALSDETRLKIYNMLSKAELCACDILEEVQINQSTLSYHMKIMTESGLVDAKKVGLWMHYSLNHENALRIEEFMKNISNSTPIPLNLMDKKCES